MKELAKKLVLAVKAIDAVEKRGRNSNQNYDYVKATDVAREVRKVLVEQGISFSYSTGNTERWEKVSDDGKKVMYYVQLSILVTFTDTESGEQLETYGLGWGMDPGDKAIYKAMTGALKYALRMNFLIPDELDPENDSHDAEPRKQVTRASSEPQSSEPPVEAYEEHEKPQPQRVNGNGHKAPGKHDATGDAAISEKQAKRFWSIALGAGKSHEDVQFAFSQAGISDIKVCPWKKQNGISIYDNLCAWAGKQ